MFNLTQQGPTIEAISREFSVFNLAQPGPTIEAISREFSVFNLTQPGPTIEAISREFSVFNLTQPGPTIEAISREVGVYLATNLVSDLAVVMVSAPSVAAAGSEVELVFYITNRGPVIAVAPWANQFLLSTDTSGLLARSVATITQTNSIAAGGSITVTQAVALPVGAYGNYFLEVYVDSAGNVLEALEGNNTAFHALTILYPPLPDLAVTSLLTTNAAVAGQLMSVSWTVTNAGDAMASAPWRETLLLADNSAGTNASELVAVTADTSLARSSSIRRSSSVILPAGLSGQYWIGVRVDGMEQVFEGFGETNNYFVASQAIAVTSPDLEVSFLTSATGGEFGQALSVTWAIQNIGTGPAFANWSDTVFLSTASNSLAGAVALGSAPAPSSLVAGGSYTNVTSVTLPFNNTFSNGTYFLVLRADANNAQPEVNEANNLASRAIPLSLPPRPDLVAANVNSLTNASPGQTIAVIWAVTNQGPASATAPWTEAIFLYQLSPNNSPLTPAATLGTFAYTNTLPRAASITRTQFVTLPVNGLSGDFRVAVSADARDEVFEENETNNVAFSANALRVPVALTLQLSSAEISEDATAPLRATLSRNGSLGNPLTVTVTVSNTNELRALPPALPVPGGEGQGEGSLYTVTIPANQPSIIFNLASVQDHVVDANQPVSISASAPGHDSASAIITVLNADLPRLTLAAATNLITEGFTVGMTVTRDLVMSNALTVALSSSSPGQLSPPNFVTIPAGSNSATFAVLAVDDVNAEAANSYSISANAPGFNSGLATVTVLDNDVPNLTVTFSASSVSEGAGAQALSMTVTRNPISAGALNIEPEAGDPALVVTPILITIPPGQASRSFPIGVIDDQLVNGTRQVAVTAYALAAGSGVRLSSAAPDVLTVTDDDGPTLKLVAAQKLVAEGRHPATTLTVTRNTPATNALLVTLTSSQTNEATVPVSTTIPLGSGTATFSLITVNDHTNDGNQTVVLTAAATGFTSANETVVVSDTDLPDLLVNSMTLPASATPQQRVPVTYQIANQGLSTAAGEFLTRVYLSRDATIGDDVLVAQFRNTNSLAVDELLVRTEQIDLPLAVANYWVVVEVDAEQTLAETLEDNNITISTAPIAVAADYSAWVQTEVTNAPANTSVTFHGRATNSLGAGVASRPVNIHVRVRGTERILSATSDENGNFTTVFTPLPGEAGRYEIFATHPGVSSLPVQDQFAIFGMKADPASLSLRVLEGNSTSGTLKIQNLSELPLSGITATFSNLPPNIRAIAIVGNNGYLSGFGELTLNYTITASDRTPPQETGLIHVGSADGVQLTLPVTVSVELLRARLTANPPTLAAGMVRGHQHVIEFEISNQGGVPSGPLSISLPATSWLQFASTNPIPSLMPGETNKVVLLLTPESDQPLLSYRGALVVNDLAGSLSIPFEFRTLSAAKGALRIAVEDEFTYFADAAPRLAAANVAVLDAASGDLVTNAVSDLSGQIFLPELNEGFYTVEVSADRHASRRSILEVQSGTTNDVAVFLPRQSVRYIWTVDEVQIEDRTRITVETTFEAFVPAPVITVEPTLIDLSSLIQPGQQMQVDLKISNHGLIAAQDGHLSFGQHSQYLVTPLLNDLGVIPANSSFLVPVKILRLSPNSQFATVNGFRLSAADSGPLSCELNGAHTCAWLCGNQTIQNTTGITFTGIDGCNKPPSLPRIESIDEPRESQTAYVTSVEVGPASSCRCSTECIDRGRLVSDQSTSETIYTCEGTDLVFTAPPVRHTGALAKTVCTDGTEETMDANGSPTITWTIHPPSPALPVRGEGNTARYPAAKSGTYRCQFEADVTHGTCIPDPLRLPEQKGVVSKLRFVTPRGDPATEPNPSLGEGQNEFAYDEVLVNTLQITFVVEPCPGLMPDQIQELTDKVRFSVEPVEGQAPIWNTGNEGGRASFQNQKWQATVSFPGLPANNDSFGRKRVTAMIEGTDAHVDGFYEIFYDCRKNNHSGGQPESPNWFHYWNQAIGNSSIIFDPSVPVGQVQFMELNGPVRIGAGAWTSGQRGVLLEIVDGIDMFGNVILHEQRHIEQRLLFNSIDFFGKTSGKLWLVGGHGANITHYLDTNGDGVVDTYLDQNENDVPDALEAKLTPSVNCLMIASFPSGDPRLQLIECDAYSRETVRNGDFKRFDWGKPGKNHGIGTWDGN